MFPNITRHILCFVLLGASEMALALSCMPKSHTLQEAYSTADSIIVGLITRCEEEISSEPWANGGSGCTFTALEVLKDSSPQRDYSGVASSSGCGLSLRVGKQYLLFLNHENQPLGFSSSLNEYPHPDGTAGKYLKILRGYRSGTEDDLSEPWLFSSNNGACSISHRVGRNNLTISRGSPSMPTPPQLVWTRHSENGEVFYRSSYPSINPDTGVKFGDVELTAYGAQPSNDTSLLTVSILMQEYCRKAPPRRRAALTVDTQTWSLNRVEMRISMGRASPSAVIQYYIAGDMAEKVLAAMSKPSKIVATATLAEQKVISSSGRDPEPVLRLETRSTRLAPVLKDFQACVQGAVRQ